MPCLAHLVEAERRTTLATAVDDRDLANPVPDAMNSATSPLESKIGLFEGSDFRIATGRCTDCAAIPQALWYFADETIAAPRPGRPVAGFTPRITVVEDLERWAATHPPNGAIDDPPLVWIAAPELVHDARLSADGRFIDAAARRWTFALVPRLSLNRSYYDETSVAFLSSRPLSIRRELNGDRFTARTIWPEDFCIDSSAALQRVDASPQAIRTLVRSEP